MLVLLNVGTVCHRYLVRCKTDPISEYSLDDGVDGALEQWWKKNGPECPLWASAFDVCLLMTPSSAPAERVFSLLKATFGDNQASNIHTR